jgi:hypothetical protein
MVLEARDYGFIGVKLKGLIFSEVVISGQSAGIHRLKRKIAKEILAGGWLTTDI